MTRDTRNPLLRALHDLNEGLRALLGEEGARPELLNELLGARDREERRRYEGAALERRRSRPRPPRPLRPQRRRSSTRLVVVE